MVGGIESSLCGYDIEQRRAIMSEHLLDGARKFAGIFDPDRMYPHSARHRRKVGVFEIRSGLDES
jgi:hypothetical protein